MEGSRQLKTLMTQMDMDLKTVDRYFKIHRTVTEMLETRGYEISSKEKKACNNLYDFMFFLVEKKSVNDSEFLKDAITELLEQRSLLDKDKNFDTFVSDTIPKVVESMNAKDISDEIKSHFTTNKLTRSLEDIIDDKIQARPSVRSVEYLNEIYRRVREIQDDRIFVYYFYNVESEKSEGKKRVNDVIREILDMQKKNKDIKDILFISENKINTQMLDDLRRYTEKMRVHIFMGDHLLFNITKHFLVPKHHLMTSDETKDFLSDKEKTFVQKLPKIYDTDPISRFYGAKAGQIFKIVRENLSDDSMIRFSEFYRYVVPEIKK